MGSLMISLASGQGLLWPRMCIVCGSEATHKAKTSFTLTKNPRYYLVAWGWTKETHAIPFPVCRKHKVFCSLLDLPAKWGFIDSFLFLLFAPALFWIAFVLLLAFLLGIKGDALTPFSVGSAIFFWGLAFLFLIFATTIKPVKIALIKESSIKICIKNEECFRAFEALNVENIIKDKDPSI